VVDGTRPSGWRREDWTGVHHTSTGEDRSIKAKRDDEATLTSEEKD